MLHEDVKIVLQVKAYNTEIVQPGRNRAKNRQGFNS